MKNVQEHTAVSVNGFAIIIIMVAAILFTFFSLKNQLLALLLVFASIGCFTGFAVINPNNATVLMFYGHYLGTIRRTGFIFTIPFTIKAVVPLKLDNFVTDCLKVNDKDGNPIEISANIVWRVIDPARAVFNVDNYKRFVSIQSESALRSIAASYSYDSTSEVSLRSNIEEIANTLRSILQENLDIAGIIIEEAKLTHLSYAAEIASAMLRRQQAVAIFQTKEYLIKNALEMIDQVLEHFEKTKKIKISDDKKIELANNLLVAMISEKEATPVISMN